MPHTRKCKIQNGQLKTRKPADHPNETPRNICFRSALYVPACREKPPKRQQAPTEKLNPAADGPDNLLSGRRRHKRQHRTYSVAGKLCWPGAARPRVVQTTRCLGDNALSWAPKAQEAAGGTVKLVWPCLGSRQPKATVRPLCTQPIGSRSQQKPFHRR